MTAIVNLTLEGIQHGVFSQMGTHPDNNSVQQGAT